jgi:hypothetical protein
LLLLASSRFLHYPLNASNPPHLHTSPPNTTNTTTQFSSSIAHKTKAFHHKVETLHSDVKDSEVALRNTVNDFLMLGDKQFIENRVYDDDEDEDEIEIKSENGTGHTF